MKWLYLTISLLALAACSQQSDEQAAKDASTQALQVILIPADGGTEDGTKADFKPVFDALSQTSKLKFELRVGQSYNAVVEALCSGSADIAFVGPAAYIQAHQRGCADLLAVGVENGKSEYYAGLFGRSSISLRSLADVKGKNVAFGDINSASSFIIPVAMLIQAKIDPVQDLAGIKLVGSHANAIAALNQGQVDVAALSLVSFDKAVNQGAVDPTKVHLIARSMALPNPPIVMRSSLAPALKAKLKAAFDGLATAPGVTPDMLVGYGGKRVDRYDTAFSADHFKPMSDMMEQVTPELKTAVMHKASKP
ncbi:phosphate/phosphite/phosphonate ABC transporter substrate-binding protein [Candidatus Phycosocius spiralis]|uniref:Selenate ABC transporter substrate-binding protein n=1 Tax=Candidatus Phycosocius spiralis TaxID=2815099 RepID=A0ABQ4PYH3_9PROT|nr:phosphate/phosphite/phosphonate ABC transporter substrate-binding protein [Candidatus Phycosocius spiralis]GIU68011.1 putative selenate ABC transporter substrate-binding protein [Candidatus Phycosocius spiralis]